MTNMKLGIGIDTGGTYTDAVIYDFESRCIVSSSKALTTKDDLSIGIGNALDALDKELLLRAEAVSLSTTLATNACVEGKGGRSKLIMIGMNHSTVSRVAHDYGIPPDDIICVDSNATYDGSHLPDPDWDALISTARSELPDADGLAIVELYAINNGAVAEKKAKELLQPLFSFPIILSSELFSGLNSVQRGAGTLLNAKLVPLIKDFLCSMKKALDRRSIKLPLIIVRSDGSLMSESFSTLRPVETILCGPASSVLGGMTLSNAPNCIIVDIGGTTTDISLVKDSSPVKASNGVSIGPWRTFVNGVFIDTFGLGGDSAVRVLDRLLFIDTKRVIPLSLLAHNYDSVIPKLEELLKSQRTPHSLPVFEFYSLVKDISSNNSYSDSEKRFCDALADKPLILRDAAAAIGSDIYRLDTTRLENEGVIIRSGLTPTDIMHIKGDFNRYSSHAAILASKFLMRCLGMDESSDSELQRFSNLVYDSVKKKLFCNIVRILLHDKFPKLFADKPDSQLARLIEDCWYVAAQSQDCFFSPLFRTDAALVGIGAPTHIFLPDVAKALGTRCIIPDNAGVANALGAIVANISVSAETVVHPNHTPTGIRDYSVFAADAVFVTKSRPEAVDIALAEAKRLALAEALQRGIAGDITLNSQILNDTGTAARGHTLDLGSRIIVTAIGGIAL